MKDLSKLQRAVIGLWGLVSAVVLFIPAPMKVVALRSRAELWEQTEQADYVGLAVREAAVTCGGIGLFAVASIIGTRTKPGS